MQVGHDAVADGVGVTQAFRDDGAHIPQNVKAQCFKIRHRLIFPQHPLKKPLAAGLIVPVEYSYCMVCSAQLGPVGDFTAIDGPELIKAQVLHTAGTVADKDQSVTSVELHLHGHVPFVQIGLLLVRRGGKKGHVGLPVGDVQPGTVGGGAERQLSACSRALTEEGVELGGDGLSCRGGVHKGEVSVLKERAVLPTHRKIGYGSAFRVEQGVGLDGNPGVLSGFALPAFIGLEESLSVVHVYKREVFGQAFLYLGSDAVSNQVVPVIITPVTLDEIGISATEEKVAVCLLQRNVNGYKSMCVLIQRIELSPVGEKAENPFVCAMQFGGGIHLNLPELFHAFRVESLQAADVIPVIAAGIEMFSHREACAHGLRLAVKKRDGRQASFPVKFQAFTLKHGKVHADNAALKGDQLPIGSWVFRGKHSLIASVKVIAPDAAVFKGSVEILSPPLGHNGLVICHEAERGAVSRCKIQAAVLGRKEVSGCCRSFCLCHGGRAQKPQCQNGCKPQAQQPAKSKNGLSHTVPPYSDHFVFSSDSVSAFWVSR